MHFTNIRIPGILVTLAALSTYTFAATVSLTSLPYNFTLAALNLTLPNANLTGAPLVLGQNGGLAFFVMLWTLVHEDQVLAQA